MNRDPKQGTRRQMTGDERPQKLTFALHKGPMICSVCYAESTGQGCHVTMAGSHLYHRVCAKCIRSMARVLPS